LKSGRVDDVAVRGEGRALANTRGNLPRPCVQIVERRGQRVDLLPEEGRHEEGVVHLFPHCEQRRAQPRLGGGRICLGERESRLARRIKDVLIHSHGQIVGPFRR
jgi:hypothetical protein